MLSMPNGVFPLYTHKHTQTNKPKCTDQYLNKENEGANPASVSHILSFSLSATHTHQKACTDPGLAHGCLLGSPSWSRLWNRMSKVTDLAIWRLTAFIGFMISWLRSMHKHKRRNKKRKKKVRRKKTGDKEWKEWTGLVEFQYCMPKRTFQSITLPPYV